ncbi:MAG: hypothetical protein Q7S70_00400 [bacterium]|nr:hypothetical protein [bacterium]
MIMQLTNVKQCPQCGSLHVLFLGNWEEVKYNDDMPQGNFLDTDQIFWCEGNECNALFVIRESEAQKERPI